MRSNFNKAILGLALASSLALTACGGNSWWGDEDKTAPLPGERISLLELQRKIAPSEKASQEPFSAPAPWRNDYWPQAGGYPNHVMQHLDLGTDLRKAWDTSIGAGGNKRVPLNTQPIVVDGRVFTMDARGEVRAFDINNGNEIWSARVKPPEKDDAVIGGGLGYGAGRLFMTAGYNELVALSPADGSVVWRTRLPTPSRAAPTATEDRVFVTTLDNRLFAISPADGTIQWDYTGLAGKASLIGAASPAVSRDIVVSAFSSGEVTGLRPENGMPTWGQNLAATRAIGGVNALSDINALPVIDQGLVIAIGFGGNLTAIDERTGAVVWQIDVGGSDTPWAAGDYIFVLSSDNELLAVERASGDIRWITTLPRFKDAEERKGPIYWAGPVLAGGRLIAVSTDERVIEVSPDDGRVLRTWETDGSVTIAPVVAAGTLFLLNDKGKLTAYR